jgi:hypothetical protein
VSLEFRSTPWLEQYFTNGDKVVRLYARSWRTGDDPYKDGLWRVCIQRVDGNKVMAELVQPEDIEWVEQDSAVRWAQEKLGKGYWACKHRTGAA